MALRDSRDDGPVRASSRRKAERPIACFLFAYAPHRLSAESARAVVVVVREKSGTANAAFAIYVLYCASKSRNRKYRYYRFDLSISGVGGQLGDRCCSGRMGMVVGGADGVWLFCWRRAPFPINYNRGAVSAHTGIQKTCISHHRKEYAPVQKNATIPKCALFDTYTLTDLRMVVSEFAFSANISLCLTLCK